VSEKCIEFFDLTGHGFGGGWSVKVFGDVVHCRG
jgi:hypothetical protein